MLYDWNWNNVEREFKQALKLNPDYATAHQRYAIYLSALGRMDDATKEIRRAHELDPLSLIINTDIALFSFLNGEYNQAIEQCKKTLELDSNFAVAVLVLGMACEQQEKLTEAMTLLRKAQALTGNNSIYLSALGHAYGVAGLKDSARIVLNNLREMSKHRYVSPYAVATVYIGIGEFDHAMEWLQKASEEHAVWLIHMHVAVDPRLKLLHLNQKFLTLIERMGIKR
jgi:tetratricopeptide (TPR) repeat protein